jgi:phosphonopyruvate decarboxylase
MINNEKQRKELEDSFCEMLIDEGFNFVSGVPCGVQKYIIANLAQNPKVKHVPAVRESEALGIAAGAYLGGKKPLVYMQNSGLLDSLNDLTSLLMAYKIPVLLTVSWRGSPGEDAPQHFISGKNTPIFLNDLGIFVQVLEKENMLATVKAAVKWMDEKKMPAVILIKRGDLK